MYIKLYESKPVTYDDMQLGEIDHHIARANLLNAPLFAEQSAIDTMRNKRNCFLYASKAQNRAPKWMCW
ncbi:unnamed protein product [Rotaria sordida]|uniref:Uncharacterized protein n=1 Tax=Rotaria sordida TaxID=392033 RepID=A0A814HD89_9BILA|nr:unnamed protein product [Rotaria sordida]CAF1132708.1 unnamed protein product [Rotaria sordida]CAF1223361.1 unnamed protein product [Rotaria sordida]CAF1357302.1 unnamed protein product [Rotaria sordida]